MDLLLVLHPLYLTYTVITTTDFTSSNINNTTISNLNFLMVWWSIFGVLSIFERYTSLCNTYFYTLFKVGVLCALYSDYYRNYILTNILYAVHRAANVVTRILYDILVKYFPQLKPQNNITLQPTDVINRIYDYVKIKLL